LAQVSARTSDIRIIIVSGLPPAMKRGLVALLASQASGAFLSWKSQSSESQLLEADSQSLDKRIQSYADKLEPGATRDFLKTLQLCAPCKQFERWGEPNDGGYVMCADGLDKGLVGAYSYGINGFDGWGMHAASNLHIPLNEYDCTNANQPQVCSGCKVNFHGKCILNNNGAPQYNFQTLSQQLQESGNANAAERSLLLKIDVEAAEWKVFAEEPIVNLKKFREIVVEYHWIGEQYNHALYAQAVKKIEQAGFAVTHLHGNNYGGGLEYFGEYSIPNVLEVTYVPKPPAGCAANVPYHHPLDTPNNQQLPEVGDAVLPQTVVGIR